MSAPASIQHSNGAQALSSVGAENAFTEASAASLQQHTVCPLCLQRFDKSSSEQRALSSAKRIGGLARARYAVRHVDGTFMSYNEMDAALNALDAERYERFAAGGRARARSAMRGERGRFLSESAH